MSSSPGPQQVPWPVMSAQSVLKSASIELAAGTTLQVALVSSQQNWKPHQGVVPDGDGNGCNYDAGTVGMPILAQAAVPPEEMQSGICPDTACPVRPLQRDMLRCSVVRADECFGGCSVVVSGGLGTLGRLAAAWAASQRAGHVVLLGRSSRALSAPQVQCLSALQRGGSCITATTCDLGATEDYLVVDQWLLTSGSSCHNHFLHAGAVRLHLQRSLECHEALQRVLVQGRFFQFAGWSQDDLHAAVYRWHCGRRSA